MSIPDSVFDISKWGAFKLPAISFAFATLVLVFRDSTNPEEMEFVQYIIRYGLGSAVIAYCQSLSYSTYVLNNEGKNDLPAFIQVLFMIVHILWFAYWFLGLACYA
ncbi:hypothetical protein [Vibrio sp. VPAP30]|uniref:Uncharacterized protein n=1 Tax=Vibrio bivalvicida TaxID=1276888 RepID=A0A177Y0R6_9VIBR|nr:hypothetical protein [Vibrio sp. VPAP30]KLN65919.1 hypothetical protein ZX61_07765 [Vibrio sp. VPAP30]OAJ94407.1 hypothetical protein APB76_09510 [Vibrio bivalvicida]